MRWSINAIPLGGYVKIHGETGENRADEDSFGSKPIWKRFLILSAGVFMNLVIAACMFAIGFAVGLPVATEGDVDPALRITNHQVSVVELVDDSPANEGLMLGDALISVDGNTFERAEALRDYLSTIESGQETQFTVDRNDEQISLTMSPEYIEALDGEGFGVAFTETGTGRYAWYLIPWKAVETTVEFTILIIIAFFGLFRDLLMGAGASEAVAGPIGIAVVTGEMARLGFAHLLQFTAVLSINLAILNILPFPALDGGRILFLGVEALRGKPNSPRIEAMIHNTGFLLLLLLVIIVTYRDIINLL